MIDVRTTQAYVRWFAKLADRTAQARINVRIRRLSLGHFGDTKSVGSGVFELRIDYGPGYRVYFARRGETLVLLLVGGDKGSQQRDIVAAKKLAEEWKEGE